VPRALEKNACEILVVRSRRRSLPTTEDGSPEDREARGALTGNSAHECSRRVIRRGPIEDTRGAPSHVRARRRVETSSGARRARDSRVQTRAILAALDQERLLRTEALETRAARSSSARISAGVLMVTLRPVSERDRFMSLYLGAAR